MYTSEKEIGCPELSGMHVDINKAQSNGWTIIPPEDMYTGTGAIYKEFKVNDKTILIGINLPVVGAWPNCILEDIIGMDYVEPNVYTCHCENVTVPDPYVCIDLPQAVSDQIVTEIEQFYNGGNPYPMIIGLSACAILLGIGAYYIIKKRR